MKLSAFTVLLFIFASCSNESAVQKEITSKNVSEDSTSNGSDTTFQLKESRVSANHSEEKEALSLGNRMLISSGQFAQYEIKNMRGCTFSVVAEDTDTAYLSTTDMRFNTPEGFRVGMKFSELSPSIQNNLTKEPGWAYYCKLSSGWYLAFCEGNSCTDSYPKKESEVKWIFKRK